MSRPRIVLSRCLGYEACRYDGGIISFKWKDALEDRADVITVCPEVLAGMGTPREPINLQRVVGKVHVIQEVTGKDWTEELEKVTDEFLSSLGNVDAFVLKSKSPSCGLGTTMIQFGESIYIASGVFARKAMVRYEKAKFTDEKTLDGEGIESFLISLSM